MIACGPRVTRGRRRERPGERGRGGCAGVSETREDRRPPTPGGQARGAAAATAAAAVGSNLPPSMLRVPPPPPPPPKMPPPPPPPPPLSIAARRAVAAEPRRGPGIFALRQPFEDGALRPPAPPALWPPVAAAAAGEGPLRSLPALAPCAGAAACAAGHVASTPALPPPPPPPATSRREASGFVPHTRPGRPALEAFAEQVLMSRGAAAAPGAVGGIIAERTVHPRRCTASPVSRQIWPLPADLDEEGLARGHRERGGHAGAPRPPVGRFAAFPRGRSRRFRPTSASRGCSRRRARRTGARR